MSGFQLNRLVRAVVFLLLLPGIFGLVGCKTNITLTEGIFADIEPAAANDLILNNQGNANFVILDVRTSAEFMTGYIAGAVNIDYNGSDFEVRLGELDKNKSYFVYCRTGNRSASAIEVMKGLEFKLGYNLLGGIVRWVEEGYPVVIPGS